jgi:hypothetical protein
LLRGGRRGRWLLGGRLRIRRKRGNGGQRRGLRFWSGLGRACTSGGFSRRSAIGAKPVTRLDHRPADTTDLTVPALFHHPMPPLVNPNRYSPESRAGLRHRHRDAQSISP